MKTVVLLGISALMGCQSRSVQSCGTETAELDSKKETADNIDNICEECHIIQSSLGREIYTGRIDDYDDMVPVVVHYIKADSRDTIMVEINTRPLRIFEGRTNDEVFVFSLGGNGACGGLTKVDIKKKLYNYVELGLGVSDIRETQDGFLIDRFSNPSWSNDSVWREWTELWDYDMRMVRR